MAETWYEAKSWGQISPIEVVRETDKFVVVCVSGREHREAKNYDWRWIRKSRTEAVAMVLEAMKSKLAEHQANLDRVQVQLAKFREQEGI